MDKDKVLIAKRSRKSDYLPEYYELPGGKVNFGEELTVALKREILGKLNLKIEVQKPFHTYSFKHKNGRVH